MNIVNANKMKNEINYDSKSFVIDGSRVFLNSASIHYFRMPREEWREVLVKAKLAGMNCVDTYFAWNVHEPNEGEWNFEGDADCGAFLDLCTELGLWVIARPGPFICAEWDFGGFPWWLGQKEGIRFREYNDVYLKYVDLYFDRICEVIRPRQITEGGSVILVQVENEYGYLADDESGKMYLNHLRDGLLKRGIDAPLITCVGAVDGAIEGANFWSGADQHYANLARKQPDMPKVVTEFWSGWFEHWGAPAAVQKTPQLYEKKMFEVAQAGFDGLSHYMFFGGTNFGGYGGRTVGGSDIFMVTSYDYDAPLNEYGRITPKYLAAKRFTYFIRAVESFLLESEPMDASVVRASEGIQVRGRAFEDQRLMFVESDRDERETFHLSLEDGRTLSVTVNPGEIVPVIDRIRIFGSVRLTCNTSIACNENLDGIHTLIVHAKNGQRSFVELNAGEEIGYADAQPLLYAISSDKKSITFDFYHFSEMQTVQLSIGDKPLRLIILNGSGMDRTWRIDEGRWISGCCDVDVGSNGELSICIDNTDRNSEIHYGFQSLPSKPDLAFLHWQAQGLLPLPGLNGWESMTLDLESVQGTAVDQPKDFSGFSQPYGYLLYSCGIESDTDRSTVLIFPKLQDTARIYMNGTEIGLIREIGSASIEVELRKGNNKLQMLVQNMGKLNFSPFLGEPKGLFDTGYLNGSAQDLRRGWKTGKDTVHLDQVNKLEGHPAISHTFCLEGHDRAILVGAVSAPLRINGKEVPLEGYQNWFEHKTVDISEYIKQGDNTIEMPYFKSPTKRLQLLSYHSSDAVGAWRMAGWPDGYPIAGSAANFGQRLPAWHRCRFDRPTLSERVHPKLKLRLTGMSKGTIWLNGMNLGRYWQIGPQEDYKVPAAWIEDKNELVLFDEEGRSPDKVRLFYDEASYLRWESLKIRF